MVGSAEGITSLAGIRVGHWSDEAARTGCTVVLLPEQTVASGEVRGGAPATREFALLAPEQTVQHVDAVVLSGGSAFGLAAADGVMRWCEEQGRGFETTAGRVPIVVGLSLYDLAEGDGSVRPDAAAGYAAADTAKADGVPLQGRIGAGTGATIGKWRGVEQRIPGGLATAQVMVDEVRVGVLLAVNAAGDIDRDNPVPAELLAGTYTHVEAETLLRANTTIGVVATNATLDKQGCLRVAQSGHDGMARALLPAHTQGDGDALVAVATGEVSAELGLVRLMATVAVEEAVASLQQVSE